MSFGKGVTVPAHIRAGCEWKNVIRGSRFDGIKDRATGNRYATLIGETFKQFRGLLCFERLRVMTWSGRPVAACRRIAWKCKHKQSSPCKRVPTMPEPARRIGGGHLGNRGVQRGLQALDGSRRHGSQVDLRPMSSS